MAVDQMRADFDPAVKAMMSLEERLAAGIGEMLHAMATAIGDTVVPYVQAHTPVDTGALRDSTVADVSGVGLERTVEIRQPATNEQGTEYVQYVVQGHRIVAWGHDTGRFLPGNPYPADALDQAEPAIQTEIEATVRAFAEGLARGI